MWSFRPLPTGLWCLGYPDKEIKHPSKRLFNNMTYSQTGINKAATNYRYSVRIHPTIAAGAADKEENQPTSSASPRQSSSQSTLGRAGYTCTERLRKASILTRSSGSDGRSDVTDRFRLPL